MKLLKEKNGNLLDQTRAHCSKNTVHKIFEGILAATNFINWLPSRIMAFKSPMEIEMF